MSAAGMAMSGNYITRDPKASMALLKQSLIEANPVMHQFNAGATYEALGSKKIGDVSVEEFAIKVDTTNPGAATTLAMYGLNPKFVLGVVGDRLRYCLGGDEYVARVFGGKLTKPLAANRLVAEALAALPAKRNTVVLIDPAGILPIIGPMMGIPKTDAIPPGPPIAVGISVAGEPVRVDIHVPFRAIERVIQASGPEEPM